MLITLMLTFSRD